VAERRDAAIGLARVRTSNGHENREPAKSRELLEDAGARRECLVAVNLGSGEGANALGRAVVLEEEEPRRCAVRRLEDDAIWLREPVPSDYSDRKRPWPARSPGHAERGRKKECDESSIRLGEVREEGRDAPWRKDDRRSSVRPEHRRKETPVGEAGRLLLDTTKGPGEADIGRDDVAKAAPKLPRFLPLTDPPRSLEDREASTETRAISPREDEGLELG
jgi:hypothetical protein